MTLETLLNISLLSQSTSNSKSKVQGLKSEVEIGLGVTLECKILTLPLPPPSLRLLQPLSAYKINPILNSIQDCDNVESNSSLQTTDSFHTMTDSLIVQHEMFHVDFIKLDYEATFAAGPGDI